MDNPEIKTQHTTRRTLWRELLWRKPIVLIALIALFASTADWLWDELAAPLLKMERPKLLDLVRWLPWYGWVIAGLFVLVILIGEHAYKMIHSAEEQVGMKENRPDVAGEILHARRPMRIGLGKGQAASMPLLKMRVSTTMDVPITIRKANLTVESDGKKYEGKKQPIEIEPEPVIFRYQFGKSREERPFDLIERIEKAPLRHFIGTEGWLQFLVDDLPDAVGIADLRVTITDELGGEHLISATSFSID